MHRRSARSMGRSSPEMTPGGPWTRRTGRGSSGSSGRGRRSAQVGRRVGGPESPRPPSRVTRAPSESPRAPPSPLRSPRSRRSPLLPQPGRLGVHCRGAHSVPGLLVGRLRQLLTETWAGIACRRLVGWVWVPGDVSAGLGRWAGAGYPHSALSGSSLGPPIFWPVGFSHLSRSQDRPGAWLRCGCCAVWVPCRRLAAAGPEGPRAAGPAGDVRSGRLCWAERGHAQRGPGAMSTGQCRPGVPAQPCLPPPVGFSPLSGETGVISALTRSSVGGALSSRAGPCQPRRPPAAGRGGLLTRAWPRPAGWPARCEIASAR